MKQEQLVNAPIRSTEPDIARIEALLDAEGIFRDPPPPDEETPEIHNLIIQQSETPLLEFWIDENLFEPHRMRPVPLLMHAYRRDNFSQTRFWNQLREKLPGTVKFNFYKNIDDAGPLVVIPHDAKEHMFINKLPQLKDYIRKVLATGRTVVTFAGGMEYKPEPGEIVFATSVYRGANDGMIPIPTWIYDIGHLVKPINKPSMPTIAFDGNTSYKGKISELSDFVPLPNWLLNKLACSAQVGQALDLRSRRFIPRHVRRRVLEAARKSPNLKTAFKERGDYFVLSLEQRKRNRAEYIQGIQSNAYTFSIRGDANGDFRMYEVMSAGRLPIVIDTQLKLPQLGDGLRWEDFCVFVPFTDLNCMADIIQQFHNEMTEEGFQEACRKSRAAFDYLMPHNYIDFIIRMIRERMFEVGV